MNRLNRGRLWLWGLLLIHAMIMLEAILSKRIPSGHDGFQYLSLQYYFLNHKIMHQEVPQWMPFMTHGTVANWWYAISASWMQQIYLLLGSWLKPFSFITLFHLGIWIDFVFFIVGAWLWSSFFIRSLGVRALFVLSLSLTTMWWLQPWHNLHNFSSLCLILYFVHMWLRFGYWTYATLAGSLFILSLLGQMPYQAPFQLWVVVVYIFMMRLGFNRPGLDKMRSIRWQKKAMIAMMLLVLLLLMLGWIIGHGTKEIVNYNVGRTSDGRTTLDNFLHYGGNIDLGRWKELWFGLSPELDNTLFAGFWLMPFLIWGLCFIRQRAWWVHVTMMLILFDFSNGGFIAKAVYYLWPNMSYFRHVSLAAIIVKIWLCLLAAMSMEKWLQTKNWTRWVIAALVLIICLSQWLVDRDFYDQMMVSITHWGKGRLWYFEDLYKSWLDQRLFWMKIAATVSAMGVGFVLIWGKRFKQWALLVLGFCILFDLMNYHVFETRARSWSVKGYEESLAWAPFIFHSRRSLEPDHQNPRQHLLDHLPMTHHPYWSNESFTQTDLVGHPGRTDHWLEGFDALLRAYWRMPDRDFRIKSPDINLEVALPFPLKHPASRVWSAYSEDKLMYFDRVARCPYQSSVSFFMTHGDYRGYLPFTVDAASMSACLDNLMADTRLPFHWHPIRYDANHAWFLVDVNEPGWLTYSDGYHPLWKASVDDIHVPIAKANLAYKMIALDHGAHVVKFDFANPITTWLRTGLMILSTMWIVFVLALALFII